MLRRRRHVALMRYMPIVLVVVALSLLTVTYAIVGMIPPSERRAVMQNPEDKPVVAPFNSGENKRINEALDGLKMLAKKSTTAVRLQSFLLADLAMGRYLPDYDNVFAVDSTFRQTDRSIFLAPWEGVTSVGAGEAFVDCMYHARTQTIFIGDTPHSSLIRGVLLAHEIQHAHANIVDKFPSIPGDIDNKVQGELSAYSTQHDVLDEYTFSKWTSIARESMRERTRIKEKQGVPVHLFTFDEAPGDSARIARILPPLIGEDLGFLVYMLVIDANIAMIESLVGRGARSDEVKRLFMRRYLTYLETGRIEQ